MSLFDFGRGDRGTPPFVPPQGGGGGPLGILQAILSGRGLGGAQPQGAGLPRDPGMSAGATGPTFPSPQAAPSTPIGVAGAGAPAQPPAQPGPQQGRPGGLQGLLLAAGDISAGYQGQVGPSQILKQQRIAEYQRARQEMLQNLQLAGQFAQTLERTPVGEVDAKRAKLREAFGKIAPGQEGVFDAVTSDVGLTPAMVEALSTNEAVKLMQATGQLTSENFAELVKNPEFLKQVQGESDTKALPTAVKKLNALRNSTDPKVRAAVEKAGGDNIATFEEYLTISDELGTEGPEGTKLTRAEADAVRRNQDILEPKLPGIRSTETFQKEQDLQRDIQLEREKAKGREAIAQAGKPQGYGARKRDQVFADKVYVPLITEGGAAEIDRALSELDQIIPRLEGELKIDTASGRVIGRIPKALAPEESIDIERRVARIVQTDLRRILGGQFAQKEGEDLLKRSYDKTLSEGLNAKTLNDLRTAMRKEYAAKRAAATYFENNGGSLEGYAGAKELEASLAAGQAASATTTRMVDPVSGREFDIPPEKMEAAKAKGLKPK